jgi:tRNA pseudouridine38-40 synthase
MHYHRLVISYKGTQYFGWQSLGDDEKKPTVQASIQQVLNKICKYQGCTISAASRTDAGVHAQGQVAKITIPIIIESEKLLLGMNSLLPADIRILQCEPCDNDFNANKDSKSKEYHYYFCTDPIYSPVINDIVAPVFSTASSKLHLSGGASAIKLFDIKLMQSACELFVGEHDFYSFAKRDSTINTTLRIVYSCEILQANHVLFGANVYYLKIIGNGFLKQMVRYIAGALFSVGKGKISLSDINDAIEHHQEEKISPKAKSRGLHLIEINY